MLDQRQRLHQSSSNPSLPTKISSPGVRLLSRSEMATALPGSVANVWATVTRIRSASLVYDASSEATHGPSLGAREKAFEAKTIATTRRLWRLLSAIQVQRHLRQLLDPPLLDPPLLENPLLDLPLLDPPLLDPRRQGLQLRPHPQCPKFNSPLSRQ